MSFDVNEHQHIRLNPLKNEWVLVSPHRTLRPWSGQHEAVPTQSIPEFDPTNPLCPGVRRQSGEVTANYTSTYVFTNDFPALLEDVPAPPASDDPLFQIAEAKGNCRVMCFHPKSNVYFGTMDLGEIENVIKEWISQTRELGKKYTWVQIFENRGTMMGCSNPHPHCQIWSSSFLPNDPKIKDANQKVYYEKYNRPMLMDYVEKELRKRERIVYENEEWVVLVPYWAVWPFETMVLPKKHVIRFDDLNEKQTRLLADLIRVLVAKYDNLFKCSFPYSMGWHGAPTGEYLKEDERHWTFHGIYVPPLLRSATVKKFMVGYELLAQAQRDVSPEKAAKMIREQSDKHYSLL